MVSRHEVVAEFIDEKLDEQTWYQENANVVNGSVAGLAAVLVYFLNYVQTTGGWPAGEQLLVVLVPFVTAVALKLTKNGIGEKQAAELKRQAAQKDRAAEVARELADEVVRHLPDEETVRQQVGPTLEELRRMLEQRAGRHEGGQ